MDDFLAGIMVDINCVTCIKDFNSCYHSMLKQKNDKISNLRDENKRLKDENKKLEDEKTKSDNAVRWLKKCCEVCCGVCNRCSQNYNSTLSDNSKMYAKLKKEFDDAMERERYNNQHFNDIKEYYENRMENMRTHYMRQINHHLPNYVFDFAKRTEQDYKNEIRRLKERVNEQSNTINVYADEIKTLRAQVQQLEGVVPFWRKWFL